MQIILLDRIANLGMLGEVVNVKDGYARNYLIPTGKAKRATAQAVADFENRRAELEKQQSDRLAVAQALANELQGVSLSIARKAGIDGHLFGSVNGHDVEEALHAHGHPVEKNSVRMPDGPVKTLGEHSVQVVLHADVIAKVTLFVEAEQQET